MKSIFKDQTSQRSNKSSNSLFKNIEQLLTWDYGNTWHNINIYTNLKTHPLISEDKNTSRSKSSGVLHSLQITYCTTMYIRVLYRCTWEKTKWLSFLLFKSFPYMATEAAGWEISLPSLHYIFFRYFTVFIIIITLIAISDQRWRKLPGLAA